MALADKPYERQHPTPRGRGEQRPGGPGSPRAHSRASLPIVVTLIAAMVVTLGACAANAQETTGGARTTAARDLRETTGEATDQTGVTSPTAVTRPTAPPGEPAGSPTAPTVGSPAVTTGSATTTTSLSTPATAGQTTTTTGTEDTYSDGIYLVGTDLSAGLYRGTVDGDGAHWEISGDANGEKFVAGGDPTGPFYIKVKSGQYLRLSKVTIWQTSTASTAPLVTAHVGDGTYRAGTDIAAGWYHGTVNDGLGYWEVSSDANGQSIVANDYVTGPFSVKVKSGQYLTLRGVTVSQ